jgi:hypothetical protein
MYIVLTKKPDETEFKMHGKTSGQVCTEKSTVVSTNYVITINFSLSLFSEVLIGLLTGSSNLYS